LETGELAVVICVLSVGDTAGAGPGLKLYVNKPYRFCRVSFCIFMYC
jgi:hypothetical protein